MYFIRQLCIVTFMVLNSYAKYHKKNHAAVLTDSMIL